MNTEKVRLNKQVLHVAFIILFLFLSLVSLSHCSNNTTNPPNVQVQKNSFDSCLEYCHGIIYPKLVENIKQSCYDSERDKCLDKWLKSSISNDCKNHGEYVCKKYAEEIINEKFECFDKINEKCQIYIHDNETNHCFEACRGK